MPIQADELRGTGDLGLVVERASGRINIIETTTPSVIHTVEGLGDLSHASAVYSPDGRYAFLFGRDGGLSKVDMLTGRLVGRIVQAGNAIGGAISQDGTLIAVSNYDPGGVRVFDAQTLEPVADIPAVYGDGDSRSKVVGLVDAPDQRFVFSLYDAGEIWVADFADRADPRITRFTDVGSLPYDGLITPDGRHYLAGLFGEDGIALLDLWDLDAGVRRILDSYGRGEDPLPVYKMPHLEGWASAGDSAGPAGGRPSRGAGRRPNQLAGGRPHSRTRTAGLRGGAAGRAAGLGQFRPSRQRFRAGHRCAEPGDHPGDRTGPGGAAYGVHAARRAGVDFRPGLECGADLRHAHLRAGRLLADGNAERDIPDRTGPSHRAVRR